VLTVEENVALPFVLQGRRDRQAGQRVRDMLDLTGLAGCREQLPNQLSGGEQQRTAIARALVADPPLLLADEPTGNLDSATGASILEVLRRAQQDFGRTVVVVTHDPRVAAIGDEVIELRDGRVDGVLDLAAARTDDPRAEGIISWLSRH
jgi:putative ABC transport system ATP-binding protein